MKELRIDFEDNKDNDIDTLSKEILLRVKELKENRNIDIEALIISLPSYRTIINEEILESLGDIDIFVSNAMSEKEDTNKVTVIVKEKEIFRIALDGPSASGKSTIAKILSGILGIKYLDTGAMYRAITYYLTKNNANLECEKDIDSKLNDINISYLKEDILINEEVVTDKLRTDIINKNVSLVSSYSSVREKLVNIQRDIARKNSIILDGRDIGTVVLPNAEYKFFLIASAEERAKRRLNDNESKSNYSYEKILEDIKRRDYLDSTRKISPLKKAENAIEIDSTNMTINEVVENILEYIRGIK
ncbi:(d)CMP kinase [Miniphocaeibacter massiliensis]|uniref:(d)CMP kinase n=1 Tax=Miniphocaeibacter massiliensis TaxID=2041841 RepID=UPI001F5C84F6|nr:(d)CMP kinase [Miniphocaeibacter massiliensis]